MIASRYPNTIRLERHVSHHVAWLALALREVPQARLHFLTADLRLTPLIGAADRHLERLPSERLASVLVER